MTADWRDLPEGLYAIPDPHDPATITYWRRKEAKVRGGGTRPSLTAWPPKAKYGPVLLKCDVPKDLHGAALGDFITQWVAEIHRPYYDAVSAALTADPVGAGKRFADLTSRCCACARTLTDDLSKTYGIGPECRAGIPADVLARYYTPALGRAHAEHLAAGEAGAS